MKKEKKEHKTPWQEKYASVEEIKAFLSDRIYLRHNVITGRVECRLPSNYESDGTDWEPISDRIVNSLWAELSKEKPTRVQDMFRVIESDFVPDYHPFRFHLGIGYHYVVRRNGEIEPGRPEWMVGAHCHVEGRTHNLHSIGVCYEGGLDIRGQPDDTRTPAQKAALRTLLEDLHKRYPRAFIVGHHDLDPRKDCPCIPDVAREYADLQPEKR